MQCFFTSWNSPKCHSRKDLNCQVHQDMKLNAGLQTNSNSKTILITFMRMQYECAVARLVINLKFSQN